MVLIEDLEELSNFLKKNKNIKIQDIEIEEEEIKTIFGKRTIKTVKMEFDFENLEE